MIVDPIAETDVRLPDADRPHPERSLRALATHSWLHCKRVAIGWMRDPATLIQALIYPTLMLLMFRVVLGDSISAATGKPSVYGTVPMITLIGAMSGAVVSALRLDEEQRKGLLGRFWTMPVHRGAGLLGRMMAESVRVLVTTALILAVGYGIGFRFDQGALAAIAMLSLPVAFGMGFAVLVTALATLTEGQQLIQIVAIVTLLMTFFNTGFVPITAYPTWLQGVVGNQPMSCAIDAMKGLTLGGPVAHPLTEAFAWSFGTIVIFLYPAIRGYRRAAETSG